MVSYVVFDTVSGFVEDVFFGNGDELSPAKVKALRARLVKVGKGLAVKNMEPVGELPDAVAQWERENAEAGEA